MSFHESSEDIYIKEEDGQTFLVAKCGVGDDDDPNESQICLDEIIGNSDGVFEWGGEDFTSSAEDITFDLEGDDNEPVLRAILKNGEGDDCPCDINLAERIENQGGELVFI